MGVSVYLFLGYTVVAPDGYGCCWLLLNFVMDHRRGKCVTIVMGRVGTQVTIPFLGRHTSTAVAVKGLGS